MKIQWLGKSCFKITHDGFSIVIDPYETAMTGYSPLKVSADMVLVSHDHRGHNNVSAVNIVNSGKPNPFDIEKLVVRHDSQAADLRGENTIHIIRADGLMLVHTGDVGEVCTDSRLFGADVYMTHCGGFTTLPPYVMKEMCDNLAANVIMPMHYQHETYMNRRYTSIDAFTDLFEGECEVIKYPTNEIEITSDMPHQVAVLKYQK